jgi:hypothetical protein
MFLPDHPHAAMRARQRERFFGASADWRAAILTPIRAIYNALPETETLSGGWWPSKTWQNVLIAATPQASAVLDPVCALEPATPILFLGLAGSLSVTYQVGDVVEPSTVLLDGTSYAVGRPSESPYPDARAVTVSCLNESMQRRHELSQQADVVEMESAWVCATRRGESHVRVVLIVSDELHGRTFLDAQLDRLDAPIGRLASQITVQLERGNG